MSDSVAVHRYHRARLAAMTAVLPPEIVTSAEIEERLAPLYERLHLPQGRLELMTGIEQRRFFPERTRPGQISARTVREVINASPFDVDQMDVLIHGSVCRDQMEPATAAGVHAAAELPARCRFFDVSNACLGILDSLLLLANMIELKHVRAGVVVGTEIGRPLVEGTIDSLLKDQSVTRKTVKDDFASLTIGSGSAAFVLADADLAPAGCEIRGAAIATDTSATKLCAGGTEETPDDRPRMSTDSEALLHAGVALAKQTWAAFQPAFHAAKLPDRVTTHQVGNRHRRMLLETLGLTEDLDFPTVERFGNTGSAALPMAATVGAAAGHTRADDDVAWLGIGSGLTCQMLSLKWADPSIKVVDLADPERRL